MELWGGPECTTNRVGETYHDQLRASGHDRRLSDLDLFADLGLSAIRYPVLWEKAAPDTPFFYDWTWADARLGRLRALGLRPIVGLVHHGSGPRYTNLLADDFATGLAAYARALAERHPWIEDWTPVNEPVTTARFSALYGFWYPHRRDENAFWRALLNQIDATRLAMAAVREVNPAARLIQTEDLGRTFATSAVRDQAAFNNVRRWMGWDLLCGHVVPGHALWSRLCDHGFEHRLRAIADAPCPPDIIGVNHYLTSDRFLDHRRQLYPAAARGDGLGLTYIDTEAVRVLDPPPPGLAGSLIEAWERYGIPIAITEVHNGCTREEQMRWMAEAWNIAGRLCKDGVDIRAVTSWALLGSYGWNTLLTDAGEYEAGAFDLSGGTPRPTAMVDLLKALASGGNGHLVTKADGWWRRPMRLHHPMVARPAPMREHVRAGSTAYGTQRAILIANVEDGHADVIAAACRQRGLAHCVGDANVALPDLALLHQPWAVIGTNASALAEVCDKLGLPWAALGNDSAEHCHLALDRLIDDVRHQRSAEVAPIELIAA